MGLIGKTRKFLSGLKMKDYLAFSDRINIRDIAFRDPYVINCGDEYILTGTKYRFSYNDGDGVYIYKSRDLENWRGPFKIVDKNKLPGAFSDFWAPEIHKTENGYVLLLTLKPAGGKRGTYLFTSESPDSEFTFKTRVTPEDKSSLDATLICENGNHYIVYCYEYIDCKDGQIRAVRLKEDFSGILPDTDVLLFKASANTYMPVNSKFKVTDGPFFVKTDKSIIMLWSTMVKGDRYVQLAARSENGLFGNWRQLPPLFTEDGGHGMVFEDFSGSLKLILHTPNRRTVFTRAFEHPVILPFVIRDN